MVPSDLGDDDPVGAPDLSRLAGPPPRPSPGEALQRLTLDLGLTPVVATVGLVVTLALAAVAWWWWHDPPSSAPEASIPLAASVDGVGPTTTVAADVVVHAAGDVARPGVYTLPAGARVADLLDAAGGAGPEADLDRVNLAAALGDGAQVHIPRVGEPTAAAPIGGDGVAGGPGAPVDLNTAGAEELETLPGVGPATSAAIVRHRQEQGPFVSVDDLISVSGIGDAKLAALRDLVTV